MCFEKSQVKSVQHEVTAPAPADDRTDALQRLAHKDNRKSHLFPP
jgi:hypothetical protein